MKNSPKTVIVGIDPGTNYTGYGVLEIRGKTVKCLTLGEIDLHKEKDPYEKLRSLFRQVFAIIHEYKPDEVALESPFYGKNVQSMLKLGRAQGVAMAAALSAGVAVAEYAPRRVKQSITGNGAASKEQVAAILQHILGVKLDPKRLDATDGLAVALCHYYTISSPFNEESMIGDRAGVKFSGGKRRGNSSWESFVKSNPGREIKSLTKKK